MSEWNCLVDHGSKPCTCFDFKSSESDELTRLREERDRYRKLWSALEMRTRLHSRPSHISKKELKILLHQALSGSEGEKKS